ncbi:MAG: class I SAM-dependent methyltransferase [Hyphomicrobiales bacterium]
MKKIIMDHIPHSVKDVIRIIKHVLKPKVERHKLYVAAVAGKSGLEIGGPSTIFKTVLPIYKAVSSLDGANFSCSTIWEGNIKSGSGFHYLGNRSGFQYIADATDLSEIGSEAYDFVLSSNCLEHVANPIKALLEWRRVLRPDGILVLVLPDAASNFDRHRQPSSFESILDRYRRDVSETDISSLDEVLALHDFKLDKWSGGRDEFKKRALNNFETRTLHHHVFDWENTKSMLSHVGFDIITRSKTHTDYYWLCKKSA